MTTSPAARTLGAVVAEAAAALAGSGFDEPRRRARRLGAAALDLPAAEILTHPERLLGTDEGARLAAMLTRMLAHEPLSRILGCREFWDMEFALSADTLDPRPDSETVIEALLGRLPDRSAALRFLDLGTGSGCLLLALLSEFPGASGVGVDIAPGAAATARHNARSLGFAGRAHFIVGDWAASLSGRFDTIVANPPYIATSALADLPRSVIGYDPRRALEGGESGLEAYRAIATDLARLLMPESVFAGEIGFGQGPAVGGILAASGLAIEGFAPDLAGIDRCVIARPMYPA